MSQHPAIQKVVERVRTDAIGGAADTAKEIVQALSELVQDSSAQDTEELANEVEDAVVNILRVTPSLAPPINALHRVLGQMEQAVAKEPTVTELEAVLKQAMGDFLEWSETALDKVAQYGAEKIDDGDVIFTYSMSSTVWRILRVAKSQDKSFELVVTESRPGNEGLWTVKEMNKLDIPVSVSIDACIGELVPESNIVFVGADAISSTGVALCKVGTYPTALVAHAHNIPFYIAADTLKFDTTTLLGLPFRIDSLHREEVLGEDDLKRAQVAGHIFDQTPPQLITGVVTEMGLMHPTACVTAMRQMKLSERLNALLPAWAHDEL